LPPDTLQPPTILVVDDEPSLRSFAEVLLRDLGYSTLQADSGRAAVQLLLQAPEAVAAVLLDMTMPGLPPEESFRLLKEIRPDLPVLIVSGEAETSVRQRFAAGTIAGYIQKPYTDEELEIALASALTKAPAGHSQTREPASPFKLVRLSEDDIATTRREFLAACQQHLTSMHSLLARRDFSAFQLIGHSLKGSGGCFGFVELTEIGRALESFAQSADAAACALQLAELGKCLERIAAQDSVSL
jgi:CheY-like chemotaxis protein